MYKVKHLSSKKCTKKPQNIPKPPKDAPKNPQSAPGPFKIDKHAPIKCPNKALKNLLPIPQNIPPTRPQISPQNVHFKPLK